MRFESVLCLPVWSFDGPSRQDGVVWFAMRTFTGLSQYPVFKVQAAADWPHCLRFCPLLADRSCFGGEEIHYALASTVSTGSWNILSTHFGSRSTA